MEKKEEKTFYDLTKEESRKYEEEFVKTRIGKTLNVALWFLSIATMIIFILGIFLSINEVVINKSTSTIESGIITLIIVLIVSLIFYKYTFARWLKLKHNIKY